MLNYYLDFLGRYDFDSDAKALLKSEGTKLITGYEPELNDIISKFEKSSFDMGRTEQDRRDIADETGINYYTVNFIFIVCASQHLLQRFIENGYTEPMFYETFEDLISKLYECRTVHGIWGCFVQGWYEIFFQLKLLKFGRFEYEKIVYDREQPYTYGRFTVNKGDNVLSLHIPTDTPLTKERRYDSYKRAYDFYKGLRKDGKLVIMCSSWLMYDKNREIFPSTMNIVSFLNDFDIIESHEMPKYPDCWRIFGCNYDGDPSKLPRNTSQQRAVADWLSSGRHTGEGCGIMIFDGEEIINRKP